MNLICRACARGDHDNCDELVTGDECECLCETGDDFDADELGLDPEERELPDYPRY